MLNLVVAKHFQIKVETFFTKVLLTNSEQTGKRVYYALTAKFLTAARTAGAVVLCKPKRPIRSPSKHSSNA